MEEKHHAQIFKRLCFTTTHGLKEDTAWLIQQWHKIRRDSASERKEILLLGARYDADLLEKLLERDEDLRAYSPVQLEEAIQIAVRHSHWQGVKAIKRRLLTGGVPVNWTTSLFLAAKSGDKRIVAELLEPPFADLEARDTEFGARSRTAFLWAVSSGSVGSVQLLIDSGVDLDVVTDHNETAIHLACEGGHPEVLRNLLITHPDYSLDTPDQAGNTPLLLAIESRSSECASIILQGIQYQLEEEFLPHLIEKVGQMVKENREDMLEVLLPIGQTDMGHNPYFDELVAIAIDHESEKCLKYLLKNGANLASEYTRFTTKLRFITFPCSFVDAIIRKFPNSEDILKDAFDSFVTVNQDDVELDFKVFCPINEESMTVPTLMLKHSEKVEILRHPLLSAHIYYEWRRWRYFAWYQFFAYVIFMIVMTTFVCIPDSDFVDEYIDPYLSHVTWILAANLLFFAVPNVFPGIPLRNRLVNITMIMLPPLATIAMVPLKYETGEDFFIQWASISILLTWVTLPFYAYVIPKINQQIAMFQLVTNDMLKHGVLFLYTLLGFSLTFYVLYKDDEEGHFSSFGQAFMYTAVVLLQGGMENSPAFNQAEEEDETNVTSIATNNNSSTLKNLESNLADLRFSGIISTFLFTFVCILALLNMLVALAVRDSKEMTHFSTVIHQKHKADWMYEWNQVFKRIKKSKPKMTRTVKPGDIPDPLYDRLRLVKRSAKQSRMTFRGLSSQNYLLKYMAAVKHKIRK